MRQVVCVKSWWVRRRGRQVESQGVKLEQVGRGVHACMRHSWQLEVASVHVRLCDPARQKVRVKKTRLF